jgi:hypothetical protein
MARGYKATLEVKCWKEHACCYCGASYRYVLNRRKTGHGASQTDAVASARARAVRSLRGRVEMMPCPACGHFQPDMVAAHRMRRHAVVFIAVTGIFLTLLFLGLGYALSGPATLWLVFLCAAAAWIAYTWIGARNPNTRIRSNKALAERLVAQKRLQPIPSEGERDERPRPVVIETGAGFWFVFLLLGATVALLPGAEVIRLGSRWPSNPDWHPPIVGPGDKAWLWIHVDNPIESLNGEWRATGSARIVNPNENKDEKKDAKNEWKVTSRTESWGDLTGVSRTAPVQLWARVLVPNQRQLERQKLRLELTLHVVVPEAGGDGQRAVEKQHDRTVPIDVHLARPFAGFLYGFFWCIAMIGGGVMFLLAGGYHLLSDLALKRSAPPTRVTALTDDEAEGQQRPTEPATAASVPEPQPAQANEQTEA